MMADDSFNMFSLGYSQSKWNLIYAGLILDTKKEPSNGRFFDVHGNVLPSQGAIPQLLSALRSLTSVF
ncbi:MULTISPECIES: hypothetical protein, partial [unclassified Pediococcus]|uniref:hypothetical protein n=1 Tax=unclassified Pediococcus TaxID=554805 RepID=UPI001C49ADD2